jgi:integrase
MRPAKLWQRKGRPGWFATVNGRQVNFGLDFDEAKKAFHASKASNRPVDRSKLLVGPLVDQYLEAASTEVAATTHTNYAWYLQQWVNFAGYRVASTLRPLDLTAWCKSRPRWNAGTRRTAIEIARRWSRWCKAEGYLDSDPLEGAKLPKVKPREGAAAGAIDAFLSRVTSPTLRDIATVLLDTGARPGELCTLSASQIDFEASTAEVVGKMGKRTISITARALAILRRLADRWPSGPLLRTCYGNPWDASSLNRQYRAICERAGVKVVPYHARHALWARAHRAGVDSIVVAKQLGHVNLKQLAKRYAHVEPAMLRDAVERASLPISTEATES